MLIQAKNKTEAGKEVTISFQIHMLYQHSLQASRGMEINVQLQQEVLQHSRTHFLAVQEKKWGIHLGHIYIKKKKRQMKKNSDQNSSIPKSSKIDSTVKELQKDASYLNTGINFCLIFFQNCLNCNIFFMGPNSRMQRQRLENDEPPTLGEDHITTKELKGWQVQGG